MSDGEGNAEPDVNGDSEAEAERMAEDGSVGMHGMQPPEHSTGQAWQMVPRALNSRGGGGLRQVGSECHSRSLPHESG